MRPWQTLAEARQKSDRQVYADWLMRNHFHLVIETPPAQSGGGDELAAGHLSAQFGHPRALGVVAATTRPEPAPCPCGPIVACLLSALAAGSLPRADQDECREYDYSIYPFTLTPQPLQEGKLTTPLNEVFTTEPGRSRSNRA